MVVTTGVCGVRAAVLPSASPSPGAWPLGGLAPLVVAGVPGETTTLGSATSPGRCTAPPPGLLPRTSWIPGNVTLVSTSPGTITGVSGVVAAFTTLGLRVTAAGAGPVGGCTSLSGTRPGAAGAPPDPLPVAVVVDVDPPAYLYTVQVAGWVPTHVSGVVVTTSDPGPATAGPSVLDLGADAVAPLDPDLAAVVAAWVGADPTGPAGGDDQWWRAGSYGGPDPPEGNLAGLGLAPGRRLALRSPRALFVDELVGAALVAEAALKFRRLQRRIRRSEEAVVREAGVANAQVRAADALAAAANATSLAVAANNATITTAASAVGILQASTSAVAQQMSAATATVARLAAEQADLEAAKARQDAAVVEARNAANAAVNTARVALEAQEDAAINALGGHAANLSAAEWDALDAAVTGPTATLAAAAQVLAGAEEALDSGLAKILRAVSRDGSGQELAAATGGVLRGLVALGWTPLLAEGGMQALSPPARRAWRAGSPARAIPIDTLVYVTGVPGGALQHNVTVVCDALAWGDAFGAAGPPRAARVMDAWGPPGVACAPAGGALPSEPSLVPEDPDAAPPCVCWAVVTTVTCPVAPGTLVAAPVLTTGGLSPRTLTTAGLTGWPGAAPGPGATAGVAWRAAPGPAVNASGGGGGPGFAAFTPCTEAPTPVGDPVVVTSRAHLVDLLGGLTCPDLDGVVPVVPAGTAGVTGLLPIDAVMGSVGAAVAGGTAPLLPLTRLTNGGRLGGGLPDGVLDPGVTPPGVSAPGVQWGPGRAPVCGTAPGPAVALARSRDGTGGDVWPTPVSVFVEAVGAALGVAAPLFRAAGFAAAGTLPGGVAPAATGVTTTQEGAPRLGFSATAVVATGPWQAVGTATLTGVWVRARVGVPPGPGGVPGATVAVVEAGRVGAPLGAPALLGPRYNWVCPVVCATGPEGAWGAPECALPTGPPGPYVCDAPSGALPLATDPAGRVHTPTYAAFMGEAPPPDLPNATLEEWSTRSGGAPWDPTAVGAGVGPLVQRLVSAAAAGLTTRPFGASDRVCARHGSPAARAADAEGPPAPGSICTTLLHNVLYTPGPDGVDPGWVGTPLEAAGRSDTVVWVPRAWTLGLDPVRVPLGNVSSDAVAACPVVDTALVDATGLPVLGVTNPGTLGLDPGAWEYEVAPVNRSDPGGWAPGVDAAAADRLCASSGRVAGPGLAPGDATVIKWASLCAAWRLSVYLTGASTPCRPPVEFELVFPAEGSGSGSGSGASPAVLPLAVRYNVPPVGESLRPVVAAVTEVAATTLDTGVQRALMELAALRATMQLTGLEAQYVAATQGLAAAATDNYGVDALLSRAAEQLGATNGSFTRFAAVADAAAASLNENARNLTITAATFDVVMNATLALLRAQLAEAAAAVNASNVATRVAAEAVEAAGRELDALDQFLYNSSAVLNASAYQVELGAKAAAARALRLRRLVDNTPEWTLGWWFNPGVFLWCAMVTVPIMCVWTSMPCMCCTLCRLLKNRAALRRQHAGPPKRSEAPVAPGGTPPPKTPSLLPPVGIKER